MKKMIPFLLLISFAACKKSKSVPTAMTVYLNGDSSWSARNTVTTQVISNGCICIQGSSADFDSTITLYIQPSYRPGDASYPMVQTGAVVSPYSSYAEYTWGYRYVLSITGEINVTAYTSSTLQGSFSFSGNGGYITGTFTAPTP